MLVRPMVPESSAAVRNASEGDKAVQTVVQRVEGVTMDTFKTSLDSWLSQVPDQPTIAGRQRAAATNSLIDQVVMNH